MFFLASAVFLLLSANIRVRASTSLPSSGNALWYDSPAVIWAREWLPTGNGPLGAMTSGAIDQDIVQLNIDSLWSGGPLSDPSYQGGNFNASERSSLAATLQEIRQSILTSENGTLQNVNALISDSDGYGTFAMAGSLAISRTSKTNVTAYTRWLDMDAGVVRSQWNEGNVTIARETFCSYTAGSCAYHVRTTSAHGLDSGLNFTFIPTPGLSSSPTLSCLGSSTLSLRGEAGDPGMTYEIIGRVSTSARGLVECLPSTASHNATIAVSGSPTEAWIVWAIGTSYDINAGDAAHNFTFQGPDPHARTLSTLNRATQLSYPTLWAGYLAGYQKTLGTKDSGFHLDLGQTPDLNQTTDQLLAGYKATTPDVGDPYVEWLAFNFGRYLLASSGRGTLPANLQGVWSNGSGAPWSGDYHANINVQQVYWSAESTDIDVTQSLWHYMQKTWMPRGAQTAEILYNTTQGYVAHDEINIFGYTGMKGPDSAQWANYPASVAWMMIHVWDHFDYGNGDVAWWKSQGYPLIKGAAQFWVQNLFEDICFKDGTLVVIPCNSPEQDPATLGCAHWQQVIWQLFSAVLKGSAAAGETDLDFLADVRNKRAQLDLGLHIGSWGQLQEWKIDMDSPTNTHRHLSHLVGLYPGYSVASYSYDSVTVNSTSTTGTAKVLGRDDILAAANVSLVHRGNGTGADADSGWEKVWRAACYAQLGNAPTFYYELNYAVKRNFGANFMSLYDPFDADPIFQMDANGAYPAVVMNALLQAPDVSDSTTPLRITLLPALPSAWNKGSLSNARVRGGIQASLTWSSGKLKYVNLVVDRSPAVERKVVVLYDGKTLGTFVGSLGARFSHGA